MGTASAGIAAFPVADGRSPGEAFRQDGITRLKGVLDPDLLARCRAVFDWSLAHPGTMTKRVYAGTQHEHWADNINPSVRGQCRELVTAPVFADVVSDLLASPRVWYSAEEIFFKNGSKVGRTPWHQDTSYGPYGGRQWCNLWISFEPLARANALEVVRGSHLGPQYDGSSYDDPDDPAKPLHGGEWLPLPDIERERVSDPAAWDVLGYPSGPGDLIAFHPHSLHGGAPLDSACPVRHTLVLRFFGEDAIYRPLPGTSEAIWEGQTGGRDDYRGLEPGQRLSSGSFLRIR